MDAEFAARFLVNVPFYGVPVALVLWAAYVALVRSEPVYALCGLVIGALMCGAAFLVFFASVYCEHCAGERLRARDFIPAILYFGFGLAMFVAMVWTARKPKLKAESADSLEERTK